MCLLSVYSPGALVNVDHLLAGAECNQDGYGFAVIVGDRIEVGKGMDAYATIDAFDRVRTEHPESWALFHSRLTTDGETDVDNCHPFIVGGDQRTVLGHNGILPKEARPAKDDVRSDTRILAESLIPEGMFGKLFRNRARRRLLQWIHSEGYGNKVAILTVDPRYKANAFILGESLGTWVGGVWHSNDGYIPWVPVKRRGCVTVPGAIDAWASYERGEITYSDYIDMRFGIKAEPMDYDFVCFDCETDKDVDRAWRYCRACKQCLDCFRPVGDPGDRHVAVCDCYVPASARKKGDDSPDAAAIDAALVGLPAEQAAEIRAVLNSTPQK